MEVEGQSFPALCCEFIPDGFHPFSTIADIKATPPYKVFQGGGTVAAEEILANLVRASSLVIWGV